MHPFFYIAGRQISGYALMGILGFLMAVLFIFIRCRIKRVSFDDAVYIFVFGMTGAVIGAKLLYIITMIPYALRNKILISTDPLLFLKAVIYGGMVFYGGLFGGIAAAYIAAVYFNYSISEHYDVLIPAVPLFAGFGRIGCFMEGCCYGKITGSALHITFKDSPFAPNNVPLIPTQLYEAAFDLIIFSVLLYISRYEKLRRRLPDIYLICYAVFRFIIEFFRGDMIRGIVILSVSQWISAGIIIFLAVKYICKYKSKFQK